MPPGGKVARQARLQGQAGRHVLGGRVPGRQSRQAGKAARWARAPGGKVARQARQVRPGRPSCAGGRGARQAKSPGRQGCQAGEAARQARPPGGKVARQARSPGRRGQSGRHVLGEGGERVPVRQGWSGRHVMEGRVPGRRGRYVGGWGAVLG